MAIMYSFNDLKDKIKRYFKFSKDEVLALIITILAYAFIISFRQWGPTPGKVELAYGLKNMFLGILIMTITVIPHISLQRISGLNVGFRVEYKPWIYGIIFSFIICIITNGYVWFLFLPGGIFIHLLSAHRLGYFRYGLNMMAHALIAFAGPLANIIIAIIFKILHSILPGNPLLGKIVLVNMLFAVFSLLPIPPLDGSRIFFQSRMGYAFLLGLTIGITVFLNTNLNILLIILGSIVVASLAWFVYYYSFERKLLS
jgi:Zn-dependent protease